MSETKTVVIARTPEELVARAEQLGLKRSHEIKNTIVISLTVVAIAICILCAIISSITSNYKMEKMHQDYDLEKLKASRGCYPGRTL